MPEHDDEMDRVFSDAYAVLMERAPTAPTLEEITAIVEASSRVTSVLGHPQHEGDFDSGNQPVDRTAESDEQREDGSNVEVVWGDVERPAPSETGRWSGVAIAVAAAILVVLGVVVVADGNGDVTEPASPAAESDPVPLPSVADPEPPPEVSESGPPPSVVDSLGYRWSLVAFGCCPGGASPLGAMNDVTVGGPGLVAVGSDGSDDDANHAAAWTSVDGITWSRVPHDEAVFGRTTRPSAGEGELGMESVTVGGPGLVAVGGPDWWYRGDEGAVVWTSVDGIIWSRVPHDEAVFGGTGPQRMMSVAAGGPGLVAVGYDGFFQASPDAVVWTSVDGIIWSRVPHDEAVFGSAFMMSVVVGGPGLVAVGMSDSGAVVWTSVDGITWSRSYQDDAVDGGEIYMSSVTAGGPGLVAVGGDGDAVVWTSVDGLTWSRVPSDSAVFGGAGDQEPASVSVGGPGLVAVGMEGYCECAVSPSPNGYVPVVWTSVDGITWSRVPYDEAVFGPDFSLTMSSVTAGGPGLVAVGTGGVIVAERVGDDADLTVDD